MTNQESMSGRLRIKGWLVQAKITNVLFGNRRQFYVSRRGRLDVELYLFLGRSTTPLPADSNGDVPSNFYQKFIGQRYYVGPPFPRVIRAISTPEGRRQWAVQQLRSDTEQKVRLSEFSKKKERCLSEEDGNLVKLVCNIDQQNRAALDTLMYSDGSTIDLSIFDPRRGKLEILFIFNFVLRGTYFQRF